MKTNSCSAAVRLEPLWPSSVLYSRKALVRQQKANSESAAFASWVSPLYCRIDKAVKMHTLVHQHANKLKLNFANMLDICFPKYWNAEDGRFKHYWGLLQKYILYGTHNSVPALLQHMVGWKQLQGVVSSVLLNFIPIPLCLLPTFHCALRCRGFWKCRMNYRTLLSAGTLIKTAPEFLDCNQSAFPQICSWRG